MSELPENLGIGTRALHAGHDIDESHSRAVPLHLTTSYVFDDTDHAARLFGLQEFGNIYSRLMNPTVDILEKRLAALDGGATGLAFASGQAAIMASICTIAHQGHNIISSTALYGGTWTLFTQTFKNLGIEVRFFDPAEPGKIAELVDENTRCVYLESLGNPRNYVPDFKKISAISHEHGLPVICDNTVMTPLLLRPIEHGVDIVVYSTTKFIGGHGTHIGGAIVDSGNFPWKDNPDKWPEFCKPAPAYHGAVFADHLEPFGNISYNVHIRTHWLRDTGGCMSPFAAWIFLQGLETLHLRMERHSKNAQKVAEFLEAHEAVDWVNYPGLASQESHANAKSYLPDGQGAILGFGVKGGLEAGKAVVNNAKLCSHLANIGDAKTLIIHPASTTHSQLSADEQAQTGVTPEFVRVSVGLEDAEDIIADLDQALHAAAAVPA
ncbi:MAG: aminotransferase class I/II-fold pyridoxal phosphate-dependent enzyme [Planctomycetota bacterium]